MMIGAFNPQIPDLSVVTIELLKASENILK